MDGPSRREESSGAAVGPDVRGSKAQAPFPVRGGDQVARTPVAGGGADGRPGPAGHGFASIADNPSSEGGEGKMWIDIEVGILGYAKSTVLGLHERLVPSGIDRSLKMIFGNLSKPDEFHADIAFVVCSAEDPIEAFISDVDKLKLVRKIPAVVAVVDDAVMPILRERIAEIATDEMLSVSAPTKELLRSLRTHLVAVRLERGKRIPSISSAPVAPSLGELLVEHELITPPQLKKALDHQKDLGVRLGDALVALGYINEEQKTRFLASQSGIPMATARQYASADLSVIAAIPEAFARRHQCIALERRDRSLIVAMLDVHDLRMLDSLRDLTEHSIQPILGTSEEIAVSIDRYYKEIATNRDASELLADLGPISTVPEDSTYDLGAEPESEAGIIRLVTMLIGNAVRDRASDIHIEPMERELVVRYRIDGQLRRVLSPPRQSHQAVVARIKILSNLDIAERRLPQDGRMVLRVESREVDIRVSILPTVYGEKVVLRILDKESFERSLDHLGFSPRETGLLRSNISKPHGLVIVTGPTGSGKSTTLYAGIQAIKDVRRNIVTVEDPVEFHIDGVAQVHVNSAIGLTFSAALRSILRQDPDIVLIGEIRDEETADMAIKMALTGHLVLSTLHTNDACGAIARFVDIGVPPLLLSASLNLVVAQRLVRRICPKCKAPWEPPEELVAQLGIREGRFHVGRGCVSCNGTGYKGRRGIFEMLPVSHDVRQLILRNAPTLDIADLARREGMTTLRESGIELALRGETTIEEVLAATTEI